MNTDTVSLDGEELLHLALQASKTGQHENAVLLLKRLVAQEPENSRALYLLGAEHAQIGLYDRAKEEIGKAINLDPGMHAARFQLGLLFISSGEVTSGLEALAPLSLVPENEPFYSFAKGLEFLVRDEFPECRDALERGISANKTNESLNDDMRRILEAIKDKISELHSMPVGAAEPKQWLSAYRSDEES
jgi:tetratricopeptide (TPR) repeat protein